MIDNAIFKVGKLKNLPSKIEIEEIENGCLDFFIYSTSKPEYSLNFKSTLNKNDFLNLEIGQEINMSGFIDEYDVVVGENETFYLNSDFNFKINRYVPHSFLLILSVRTDNTYIYIENEFKLK